MISLMSRILAIAGKYRRNIKIAFIFSFLKSMLAKSPIGLAFIAFNAFYNNKMSDRLCFLLGITLIVCVLFQAVFKIFLIVYKVILVIEFFQICAWN